MAISVNTVILAGNLTRDPEVRYLPSGQAVADLGLAVNERVQRNGEWTEVASFIDVTVWGKTAENCGKYLRKGRPVLVEGRLRMESWETKEGEKRSKLKVVAGSVQFLDSGRRDGDGDSSSGSSSSYGERSAPPRSAPAPRSAPPASAPADDLPPEDDDLPF